MPDAQICEHCALLKVPACTCSGNRIATEHCGPATSRHSTSMRKLLTSAEADPAPAQAVSSPSGVGAKAAAH